MRRPHLIAALPLIALGLAGCVSGERAAGPVATAAPEIAPIAVGRYAALTSEPYPVAAIDPRRIPERYLRHEVVYPTPEPPGTIVIDTASRYLYLVQPEGKAIRYGVGVGKEGMSWSGEASVGVKRAWPDWYPPKEMIARRPDIEGQLHNLPSGRGLPGGAGNPLGARALYLMKDGKDTLYRIHGTLEPYTMGQAVSSGCIRMINQDAIDLFSRVDVGTRVVVLPDGPRSGPPSPDEVDAAVPGPQAYADGPAYAEAAPRAEPDPDYERPPIPPRPVGPGGSYGYSRYYY